MGVSMFDVMGEARVPCGWFEFFASPGAVAAFAKSHIEDEEPVLVRPNVAVGTNNAWLSKGKDIATVAVCCAADYPEALIAVQQIPSGASLRVRCFTDAWNVSSLGAVCESIHIGSDGFVWPASWTKDLEKDISREIMKPIIRAMNRLGIPFCGMLTVGLSMTMELSEEMGPQCRPRVLGFQCVPPDAMETQFLSSMLETDLAKIREAISARNLGSLPVQWHEQYRSRQCSAAQDIGEVS